MTFLMNQTFIVESANTAVIPINLKYIAQKQAQWYKTMDIVTMQKKEIST